MENADIKRLEKVKFFLDFKSFSAFSRAIGLNSAQIFTDIRAKKQSITKNLAQKICDTIHQSPIDDPVRRVWWVRSERHEELVPKWKVLTSHCGRKTFVVSALSLDIASEVIMRWTGHKNHKTMKPYIAIVDDIKKKSMSKFDMLADKMTDL